MIIEFGGIDGSGKTTQTNLVEDYLSKHYDVYKPQSAVVYSSIYPQTLEERKKWYKEANKEDIVRANIDGSFKRFEDAKDSGADFVLLDRGYYTTKSSNVGRLMNDIGYRSARKKVEKICEEYKIKPFEDIHIIYVASWDLILERLDDEIFDDFFNYLKNFSFALSNEKKEKSYMIRNEDSIENIMNDTLDKILNM